MYFVPHPLSALTFDNAAVNVVFPWSTCPIVPTFTCGLVRSNFALAIALPRFLVRSLGPSSRAGLNRCPHPPKVGALQRDLRAVSRGGRGERGGGPAPASGSIICPSAPLPLCPSSIK